MADGSSAQMSSSAKYGFSFCGMHTGSPIALVCFPQHEGLCLLWLSFLDKKQNF